MTFEEFKASLKNENPPSGISTILRGLWHDAKGDWNKAHDLIDGSPDHGASWAHAYLHRKEGDQWNADYWYRIAGRQRTNESLEEEWESLIQFLI